MTLPPPSNKHPHVFVFGIGAEEMHTRFWMIRTKRSCMTQVTSELGFRSLPEWRILMFFLVPRTFLGFGVLEKHTVRKRGNHTLYLATLTTRQSYIVLGNSYLWESGKNWAIYCLVYFASLKVRIFVLDIFLGHSRTMAWFSGQSLVTSASALNS